MDNSEVDGLSKEIFDENQFDGENVRASREEIYLHGDEEQREKLLRLPLSRIKTIIKMDPEVNLVNQEAAFLVAKSVVNK